MTTMLDNLASTINREHELAYDAAIDALEHAILCGEALIRARDMIPEGEWQRWINDHLAMSTTATGRYMRIAAYRQQLMTAEHRPQSINAAVTYLRDIGAPVLPLGRNGRRPSFDVDEARRLRELGMTYVDIGKALGVSDVAVWRQLTPGATKRAIKNTGRAKRRQRAEQRAAAERDRDWEMAAVGGNIAEAYSLLRQCEAVLVRAVADGGDKQHDLRKALTHVHRATDAVIRAVDLEPRRRANV